MYSSPFAKLNQTTKNSRSNSLTQSSPNQPKYKYHELPPPHPLNATFDYGMQLQNFKKILGIGKENQVAKRNSFKTIQPVTRSDDQSRLLEQQIQTLMNESKQLTVVLDQQLQINQSLKDQLNYKSKEVKELEQKLAQREKDKYASESSEQKKIVEQLQVYKNVVESLELKISSVIQENTRLNEYIESIQSDFDECKKQLRQFSHQKEQNKFNSKEEWQSQDWQQKCKRLKDENILLKKKNEEQEFELTNLRQNLENLRSQVSNMKGVFTPNESDQQKNYYENEIIRYQEIQYELESQIKYFEQVSQIDQQKMKNLEEKMILMTKENLRMQEQLKMQRRKSHQIN